MRVCKGLLVAAALITAIACKDRGGLSGVANAETVDQVVRLDGLAPFSPAVLAAVAAVAAAAEKPLRMYCLEAQTGSVRSYLFFGEDEGGCGTHSGLRVKIEGRALAAIQIVDI